MPVVTKSGKKILVTGATGAFGPQVVKAVHEAGYPVRVLALNVPDAGLLPDEVEVHMGDVTDPVAVRAAMEGLEACVHMVALLHVVNPPPSLHEEYERINVGGTAKVVEAAIKFGLKRLVFFSTIAVYGCANGRILTEDSEPQPENSYAQTKLAAERIVLEAKRADGQPLGTVLRLGAVYGSRIRGNYLRLLRLIARGWFVPIGDGRNRRTLIYDRDAARVALDALHHPAAAGKIFNVSDGHFHTMSEIITAMCLAIGRTPPRIALPVGPVRFLTGLLEDTVGLIGWQLPIGRATIDKYTEDVAVSSQRIQTELGFVPRFDLRAGWRRTVQAIRQNTDL